MRQPDHRDAASGSKATTLESLLTASSFTQDPYPSLARLRAAEGLYWSDGWGAWVATRYEDVAQALAVDGRDLSAVGQTSAALSHLSTGDRATLGQLDRLFSAGLLWSDPPNHDRIRAIVNKALNPRDLERLRPRISSTIRRAATQLPEAGGFDVVADFASPVPVAVLAELLGIPAGDVAMLRSWADRLVEFMGRVKPTFTQARVAQDVVLEAGAYVDLLAARSLRGGGNGVIGRLAAMRAAGAQITTEEFQATIIVLLVGGHRTTAAAIASGILALARHPELRASVRADGTRMPSVVEELLRHESPHQRTIRIVRREVTLAGTRLREGDVIYLLNGAANRDDLRFDDPAELRIDRRAPKHLTFSSGIHFCIGAPLARIELAESLGAFLSRYPDYHVVGEPTWLDNHTLRSLTSLRVEL